MERRSWKSFDLVLLAATILIVILGVALIYSATYAPEAGERLSERSFFRQAVFAVSGLVILLLTAWLDYHLLGSMHWPLYVVILALLGVVAVMGHTGFGAQSWLSARRGVQPSELSKVLLIVFLAKFMSDHEEQMQKLPWVLSTGLLILPMVGLVYWQPDMGTVLILMAIWVGMLFAAGVRFQHLGLLGAGAAAATPLVWSMMKGYMKERISVFFNPASDVSGISYNSRQALISIGSGSWFGKGFLHGTQSQLYFLRVRHTDYVFSVLCEELGFVGGIVLLALLLVLLLRILRAATLARDSFGRLICCGVATMIAFQSIVNIAVNVGLMPVTGLTLPLVSYGGSSLWTTLLGIGLVESVIMRHKKLEFGD